MSESDELDELKKKAELRKLEVEYEKIQLEKKELQRSFGKFTWREVVTVGAALVALFVTWKSGVLDVKARQIQIDEKSLQEKRESLQRDVAGLETQKKKLEEDNNQKQINLQSEQERLAQITGRVNAHSALETLSKNLERIGHFRLRIFTREELVMIYLYAIEPVEIPLNRDVPIAPRVFPQLSEFISNLKIIKDEISYIEVMGIQLQKSDVEIFAQCPLRGISLIACGLTDEMIDLIKLDKPEVIRIGVNNVSRIPRANDYSRLENLDIAYTNVGDPQVGPILSHCYRLLSLDMSFNKGISFESLKDLQASAGTRINLIGTSVTGKDVAKLISQTKAGNLAVPSVSDAEAEEIHQAIKKTGYGHFVEATDIQSGYALDLMAPDNYQRHTDIIGKFITTEGVKKAD